MRVIIKARKKTDAKFTLSRHAVSMKAFTMWIYRIDYQTMTIELFREDPKYSRGLTDLSVDIRDILDRIFSRFFIETDQGYESKV